MEQFISNIHWQSAGINLSWSLFFMIWSGFLGGTETAFLSLNRIILYAKQGQGIFAAKILMTLIKYSSYFITSIVILNNLTLIAGTLYMNKFFIESLNLSPLWALLGTVVAATPLALILGEVLPKAIFREFADYFAYSSAGIWFILHVVAFPLTLIVRFCMRVILFVLRIPYSETSGIFGKNDFDDFLDISLNSGALNPRERNFINNILEFREVQASEAMTPLAQMNCVEENQTVLEALNMMNEYNRSILAVYQHRIDNPTGRVRAKDLIKADPNEPIKSYVQESFFVPETAYLEKVLLQMQRQNIPLVFVADEYGGVVGVLRVEDIVAEIVGEVIEEGDIEFTVDADGQILAQGLCDIDDLFAELNLFEQDLDSKTLSGFIMEELGRMPQVGDRVFKKPWYFEVLSLEGRRVKEVLISKNIKKTSLITKNNGDTENN